MSNKEETYKLLLTQAKSLIEDETDLVANMSNIVSLIFHSLPDLNGTTYYRFLNNELVLRPFQGKPACMHIPVGKGVCGTVASTQTTEIVPNVHDFSGHIACDSVSNSEIVVPVFNDDKFWGVLDLDSPKFNTFDNIDDKYLRAIAPLIFGVKSYAKYKGEK